MATTSGVSVEDEAYDYMKAFPALSKSEFNTTPVSGTYNNKFSVKTSTCTQVCLNAILQVIWYQILYLSCNITGCLVMSHAMPWVM